MTYGNYPDFSKIQRLLVIQLRHLGDLLLTTPLFTLLKKAAPHIQLDVYVYSEAKTLIEHHPAVDEILVRDRKKSSWREECAFLWKIRKRNYDCVINLTEGDRGAWVARLSGASTKVGVDARVLYTHVVKRCHSPRHTVERQLDVLRRIGIFPSVEERELFLSIPDSIVASTITKIGSGPFILIHPTSRWKFKCWPVRHMRAVVQHLLAQGHKLIITSGPDPTECAMVQEIVEGASGDIVNLAGKLSLLELGALIKRASILLTVDSLPLHMASVFKTPVVVLFGPTSEETWGPWRNPNARVVKLEIACRPCFLDGCGGGKVSDCLERISVKQVLHQLSELELVSKIRIPSLATSDQLLHFSRTKNRAVTH